MSGLLRPEAVHRPLLRPDHHAPAAELRKNGRADEARALARLRKPSAALWVVNRVAATDGKGLAALFDAVARLRRSQLRDPRAAAEALRAQRAALDTLVGRGRRG